FIMVGLLIGSLLLVPNISYAKNNGSSLMVGDTAYIDVAVATLWTAPDILRPVDHPSSTNPVDIRKWTDEMTYEQQIQLSDDGMLETQALYGNKVTILDEEGEWVKVAVDGQPEPGSDLGYTGWMPKAQLNVSFKFAQKTDALFLIITARTTYSHVNSSFNHLAMELTYITLVPYLVVTTRAYRAMNPDCSHSWIEKSDSSQDDSITDIPHPTGE